MAFTSSPFPSQLSAAPTYPTSTMPAMPAKKPQIVYAASLTLSTVTPERKAARGLPPTAYNRRPQVVRERSNAATTTTTAQMITALGTGQLDPRTQEGRGGGT